MVYITKTKKVAIFSLFYIFALGITIMLNGCFRSEPGPSEIKEAIMNSVFLGAEGIDIQNLKILDKKKIEVKGENPKWVFQVKYDVVFQDNPDVVIDRIIEKQCEIQKKKGKTCSSLEKASAKDALKFFLMLGCDKWTKGAVCPVTRKLTIQEKDGRWIEI